MAVMEKFVKKYFDGKYRKFSGRQSTGVLSLCGSRIELPVVETAYHVGLGDALSVYMELKNRSFLKRMLRWILKGRYVSGLLRLSVLCALSCSIHSRNRKMDCLQFSKESCESSWSFSAICCNV